VYTKVSLQFWPGGKTVKSFPSQLPLCEKSPEFIPMIPVRESVCDERTVVALIVIVCELVDPMSVVGNGTELSDNEYEIWVGMADATPEGPARVSRVPPTAPRRSDTPKKPFANFETPREIRELI